MYMIYIFEHFRGGNIRLNPREAQVVSQLGRMTISSPEC